MMISPKKQYYGVINGWSDKRLRIRLMTKKEDITSRKTDPWPRMKSLCFYIAGLLIIAFDRFLFLVYEQAHFNSDDARIGLMAKHIAELKDFPVFLYGQKYMLAVEAYLAAPLFAAFEPSVFLLKLPLLCINIAIFTLAGIILTRESKLSGRESFLSLLYVAAPGAVACAFMVEPGGGNVEPLLWVLLLWAARDRPLLCGALAGLGFLNREFVVYGIVWLLVFRLLERKLTATYAVSAAGAFSSVWASLKVISLFTPNNFGKSSAAALAINPPAEIISNLGYLFSKNLSAIMGYGCVSLGDYSISSGITINHSPLFYISIGCFALLSALFVYVVIREKLFRRLSPKHYFPMFLVLTGASACVSYIVFSADVQREVLVRYTLMAVFIPVGASTLVFSLSRSRAIKILCGAAAVAIAVINLHGSAMLWREYRNATPPNPQRDLANYLVKNDIRLATADYWTAYHVTFLANEEFIGIAQERYERIKEYTGYYSENVESAYRILDVPCPGGEKIHGWYVCPPVIQSPRNTPHN